MTDLHSMYTRSKKWGSCSKTNTTRQT